MTMERIYKLAWFAVICMALLLIAEPWLVGTPFRVVFSALFIGVMAASLIRDYRAGILTQPVSTLLRNPPRSTPLEMAGAAIGCIGMVWSIVQS